MIRLSIVIPCPAPDGRLDDTLASVLQNRPDSCEVLVVHGAPYEDPYGLKDEVRFVAGSPTDGPIDLVNRGVEASEGEVVHVLGCGIEVEEGWTAPVLARFADPTVGSVTPLVVERKRDGRILACGVSAGIGGRRRLAAPRDGGAESLSKLKPLGPLFGAGFYRRRALDSIGGFEPRVGAEYADLDAALLLDGEGYRNVCEYASRLIGGSHTASADSPFAQGLGAERVFWRHAAARGVFRSVLLHPFEVFVEFAGGLARPGALRRLAGRLFGVLESRRHMRRRAPTVETVAAVDKGRTKNVRFDTAHTDKRLTSKPETATH